MKELNHEERFELLNRYIQIEPEIVINCEPYLISAHVEDYGIVFHATSMFSHTVEGIAVLSKELWEKCNVGLTMCYFYDKILSTLERRILAYNGGASAPPLMENYGYINTNLYQDADRLPLRG